MQFESFDSINLRDQFSKLRPSVSCAMMLKNEAPYLNKALSSSAILIDELIVAVDDSTTDETYEIASAWVDKIGKGEVFYYKWKGDFSYGRNIGIEKCTMDWVFILDGHEFWTTDSISKLPNIFASAGRAGALSVPVINEEAKTTLYQIRFFKNHLGVHFEDPVHNRLVAEKIKNVTAIKNLALIHRRLKEHGEIRRAQREKMVYELMHKAYSEDPNNNRALQYLARQTLDVKRYEESEVYHLKFLKVCSDPLERHITRWNLAHVLMPQGKRQEIEQHMLTAIKEYPDLPHAYIYMGLLKQENGDFAEAFRWFKEATLRRIPPISHVSMASGPFTWVPWFHLALLYNAMGLTDKALSTLRHTLTYKDVTIEALEFLCQKFKIFQTRLPLLTVRLEEQQKKQHTVV